MVVMEGVQAPAEPLAVDNDEAKRCGQGCAGIGPGDS